MGAGEMAAKKRIGRPPKSEEDRKAVNFTFRSRGQMRDLLQAAAAASKRSISEEIEYRLQNSFREEDSYGGPRLSAVFRLLADYKALAEAKAGEPWTESDRLRDEIGKAFVELIAKEIPGFYSVHIEMLGRHGERRGFTGYASEEIEKREAQFLKARREAPTSRSEQPATDKKEDSK
jgi:Arc-like DNA binding domain